MKHGWILVLTIPALALAHEFQFQQETNTIPIQLNAVPQMDGSLAYWTCWDSVLANPWDSGMSAGDGPNWFYGGQIFGKSYVGFYLPAFSDTVLLRQATLHLYQWYSEGNMVVGGYPFWDIGSGFTLDCIADHVDIGPNLDFTDWTAGDPGDPATLATNIGVISSDSVYEWKILDVTEFVQNDINSGRPWSQFRVRFPIGTDWDLCNDKLSFRTSESSNNNPILVLITEEVSPVSTNPSLTPDEFDISAHPNPFNPTTVISYKLPAASHVSLQVYDTSGRLVATLVDGWREAGEHEVIFDGSKLASGIYLYHVEAEGNMASGKMLLLK